jgi:hypothetical protein
MRDPVSIVRKEFRNYIRLIDFIYAGNVRSVEKKIWS